MEQINNRSEASLRSSWKLLISLIFFLVALVIVALGYLLLEDQIHEYLNRKSYTAEELNSIAFQATKYDEVEDFNKVVNGIHVRTGLHADPNIQTVIGTCTSCHSAKLITQNRATRDGWEEMIRWMQETQGLPELGKAEPVVLDYLAKYYAPENIGRRKNIDMESVKWYVLNLEEEG